MFQRLTRLHVATWKRVEIQRVRNNKARPLPSSPQEGNSRGEGTKILCSIVIKRKRSLAWLLEEHALPLSGILSRAISKYAGSKSGYCRRGSRVERIAAENQVTCIKSGISLDAFYRGGGEGGNRWRGISVFFPRKNGWYESDIRGKLRRNNSWEYVVALVQDSWLNFRLYISASSLFRLNRVRARLGKVEEVGRRNSEINFKNDSCSSSLDSFWMRAFTSFHRDRLSIRKRFLMILISLRY